METPIIIYLEQPVTAADYMAQLGDIKDYLRLLRPVKRRAISILMVKIVAVWVVKKLPVVAARVCVRYPQVITIVHQN